MKFLLLVGSHAAALIGGVALGIYLLPILIAPQSPALKAIQSTADAAQFRGTFVRDLADSDALHWGEGELFISPTSIALEGRLAPGPDYRLYLSPQFVETEEAFEALKSSMVEVAPVRTFANFMVNIPSTIDPAEFTAVIIWCESFGQFITSATYH